MKKSVKSPITPKIGSAMTPVELARKSFPNGFKIRVVKYRNAPEVVLMPLKKDVKSRSFIYDKCIEGAIEIIIPEKHNNKTAVKMLEDKLSKSFSLITDAKWFKADKNTSFEKTGDNVLELFGYLTKSFADKCPKVLAII